MKTHKDGIDAAISANLRGIENGEPPQLRMMRSIAAYLEARGAVLCEREPVACLYRERLRSNANSDGVRSWLGWSQWMVNPRPTEGFEGNLLRVEVRPLHASLSDNPKGENNGN